MTRAEALPIARRIAAGYCEIEAHDPAYVQFMRDGAYDDDREVQIAIAALLHGILLGGKASSAKPANDPVRGTLNEEEFKEYLGEFTPDAQVSA